MDIGTLATYISREGSAYFIGKYEIPVFCMVSLTIFIANFESPVNLLFLMLIYRDSNIRKWKIFELKHKQGIYLYFSSFPKT